LTAETYVFRTGTVTSNTDVPGPSATGTYSDLRHAGSNNFSGLLSASLNNPAVSQKCGLNVALVLDQSGSMAGTKQTALKAAANDTITALTGTPSRVALYTFASLVGPSVASTSTATVASAASLHTFINGLAAPASSTNWDAGLNQVAAGFDLVILLTDGAPTTYGNNAGSGSSTYFQYVDEGIFSANKIKSGGATLVGVGIGLDGSTENLRAVSGATLDKDYYLASSATFGQVLKDLATGNCSNQLTIQKQIQDPTGTLVPNSPLANGWNFTNSISLGSTIDSAATTAQVNGQNGFASAAVSIPAAATPTVSVTETLTSEYTLVSAHCTVNGIAVATTVNGTTATFAAQSGTPMSCLFTNKQKSGHWSLSKSSSPTAGTSVGVGDSITYTLTAHNPSDVTVLAASATDDLTDVLDDATLGALPSGLTKVGSVLTWAIGNLTADQTKTISYTVTVKSDAYDAVIKNVVTPGDSGACEVVADCTTTHTTPKRATLTLVKSVNNGTSGGTRTPTDWNLSADGGVTGTQIVNSATGVTHTVIPGAYAMSESAQWNGYTVEGTWVCTGQDPVTGRPESNVVVITAGEDVTCTITNKAVMPSLTLNKVLANGDTGSTHTATDWSLSAAGPTAVSGVSTGTKTFVAVGAYTLSESGPAGYSASVWNCGNASVVDGVVTLGLGEDVTCTVTNTAIAPTLTLNKVVVNGTTGATHVATDWSLSAAGPTAVTSVATGTKSTVKLGDYTLTESGPAGYTASAWNCGSATVVGHVVTVPLGTDVTCTVTNTADASSLTLVKSVDNGLTGATHTAADWALSATGPTAINNISSGTKTTVKIGDYTLGESGPDGYTASVWNCGSATVVSGVVTVALGQDVTCTVTNVAKHSSLTLNKVVLNGFTGSTFTSSDWALSADGPTAINNVTSGTKTSVKIGKYALAEAGPMGYTSSLWDCGSAVIVNDVVSVSLGQDVVCTVTNTAVMSTLTLNKIVDNGNTGAMHVATDWSLSASGPTTVSEVTSGTQTNVPIGRYTLSESGPDGYSASAWDCGDAQVVAGVVTVTLGQDVVCTITNTAKPASLTLIKRVENGATGATHTATDWTLSASGPTAVSNVAPGTKSVVKVGNYALSEVGPAGYTASAWDCGNANVLAGVVSIEVGQEVTCRITNTAQASSLTLFKTVDNGQTGATHVAGDWSLSASGPTQVNEVSSGTKSTVKVGSYSLTEAGPAGYTASAWNCGDATVVDGVVTVGLGEDISCSINNSAQASSLTLNKTVINGSTGATHVAGDWTLSASGPTAVSDVAPGTKSIVQVGTYSLTEAGPAGYTASAWDCGNAAVVDGKVSIALGQNINCSITNTAVASSLTLVKQVDNGQTGGTHVAGDWSLSASGPTTINGVASGARTSVQIGDYALSETGPNGYVASAWDCGSATVTAGVVAVLLGKDVTCTVTNVANHSTLTLKTVIDNGTSGATFTSSDWALSAAGPTAVNNVITGTKTTVKIGDYSLSESGPLGYTASAWDCGDATVVDGVVSVPLGQDVVCTITNTAVKSTLTLNKIVDNGTSGATYTPANWWLSATGPTAVSGVSSGTTSKIAIGEYTLSETGPDGYSASAWDCGNAQVVDGIVSVTLGQNIVCTVTNTAQSAALTLIKHVANGTTGATHVAADWALSASGPSQVSGVTSGTKSIVKVGDYALSESGPAGYTSSAWDCGTAELTDGVVTVGVGQEITCEITNTAQDASLTLVKTVDNGQTGATAVASDWALSASGPTAVSGVSSGTKSTVKVGSYSLTESGPAGYTASAWNCGDVTVSDSLIAISVGQHVTCTVHNTAQASSVTLDKTVNNGTTGATFMASDWTLSASGPTSVSNVVPGTKSTVQVGTYTLSESGPAGYTAAAWDCGSTEVVAGKITVALGQDVSCTVTNTAVAPTLTLNKVVDNGQTGATHTASEWKLSAAGPTTISQVTSGTKTTIQVGTYSLGEIGPDGYTASTWDCGDVTVRDGRVQVAVGQDISCTVTNKANPSSLTLNKIVVNGETGATHVSTDWTLSASGPTTMDSVLSGTKTTVKVGSYTLSERGASGYESSVWDCGSATVTAGVVDVAVGQDVSCTVTNTAKAPLLTLRNIVDNGTSGATHVATDWALSASGATSIDGVTSGTVTQVKIGTYALSEAGPAGYTASTWDCGEAVVVDGVVTIALGDDVTCTIINTAIAPTLTLNKVVDNGETGATYTEADWSLSASGPTNIAGVTSGTKLTVMVGTYSLSESGPAGYTASAWDCGDVKVIDNTVQVAVGQDVSCAVINTATPATWTVSKTSDPATGSAVNPGEKISYTVTLTHTSGVMPADVVVTDDLSSVLNHASMGSIAASSGNATLDGTTITWHAGAVASSATLTYEVTVDANAFGVTLTNVVTPPTGGSCVESCETQNFTPHFFITKTSDPGNGVVVEPGQVVTYTMTARNDSLAALTGATATDDMSQVLDNATLTLPLSEGLTLESDGVTMTWSIPTLAPGASTAVSYVVTINSGTAGLDLINVVTPGAGGDCEMPSVARGTQAVPPETGCDNSHYINAMDLTVLKKHTVPTGTTAVNGKSTSPITYDLTVTNSGKLAGYDDALNVVVTDALEGHLQINVGSIIAPEWDTSATTVGTFSAKYIGNGGVLAPGASSTITFTAVITRPIDFSEVSIAALQNTACVSTSGAEVSTANNCSTDETPIEAVALDPTATCRNNILTMDYSIPLYGNPTSPGKPVTVAMIWWAPGGYKNQDVTIDANNTAALLANGALRVDYVTTPAGWKQGQLIKGFVYWPGVSLASDGTVLAYPGRFKTSDGRWVLNPSAPFYSIHSQATVEVRITSSTTRTPVTVNAEPTCYPRAGQLAFTGVNGTGWHLVSLMFGGLALAAFLAARRRRIYG